jgi:Cys-tRNA synthase (O-phospho-L-seryl-tRNA:Cys-tRNA synthase)
MGAKRKKRPITKGRNIRFSDSAFELLKKFCDEKGYRLGYFCESGALDKMRKEAVKDFTS